MTSTLEKIGKAYRRVAQTYGSANEPVLFEVFNAMGEAFNKSVDPCRQLQDTYRTSFSVFLKYMNSERHAINSYFGEFIGKREEFVGAREKLNKKKEHYYEKKATAEWQLPNGCPYSEEKLLKDKALAFSVMFSNETKEKAKLLETMGYYMNKCSEEYRRVSESNIKKCKAQFVKTTQDNCKILSKVVCFLQ